MFSTHSLHHPAVSRILNAALQAVDPGAAVRRYLQSHPLPASGRVFGLAVGKAALPMAQAFSDIVHPAGLLAIPKHTPALDQISFRVQQGDHPLPGVRSVAAGRAALEFVFGLRSDDLLVCLISGGGSALMTAPLVSLADMQALTGALLACGARIDEMNLLRRRLDQVKGGGLARSTPARVLSLILSDVVGNPLETIASGPTAPDPFTRAQALAVIEKYELVERIPAAVLQAISTASETPKPGDPLFERVQNVIVGDNALAAQAALQQAGLEGMRVTYLGSAWQGEASQVGRTLAERLARAAAENARPFCLVAGGETTVTLHGSGKGGRNQELALAAAPALSGIKDVLLVALATDGEDGPTDAAGGVVDGETLARLHALGLDPDEILRRNDSYTALQRLDDLLITGPTGTNVNDLTYLFGL